MRHGLAARAFALFVCAGVAFDGCSRRGTAVLAEVWPGEDALPATGVAAPQLLAPGAKRFVAPGPSRTTIALTPGIYVRVAAATELAIAQLSITEDGNETGPGAMTLRDARIEIIAGELSAYLPADDAGGNSHIVIQAPGFVVSAEQDSLLFVRVTPADVAVACVRGSVQLEVAGERRDLAAGDYAILSGDVTHRSMRIADAAENSSSQNDIGVALADESAIRELVGVHASLPAPWVRK